MKHEIVQFTARDGQKLFYRLWDTPHPKGVVLYLHGIQSHSEWYRRSCSHIAENGYKVCALDRRGAGLNTTERGDIQRFEILLTDIEDFITTAGCITAQKDTVHLVGISWGGKTAVAFGALYPEHIHSLLLVAPGICPQVSPSPGEKLQICIACFLDPTKNFKVPISSPALFTTNPEKQKYIKEDSLSLRYCTARFSLESFKLDLFIRKKRRTMHLPVFVMLAEHDKIIDNTKTLEFLEKLPARKKWHRVYPGGAHTLEFEQDSARIFFDKVRWFDSFC